MIKPKFFGYAEHGKFVFHDPDGFAQYMRKFDDKKEMEIVVGPRFKRRTQGAPDEATNFNGYYWGVVVRIIADEMGEIDDQVIHELLQMMFNKKGVRVMDPETHAMVNVEVPRGTKNLSGGEFADYCKHIQTWAAIPGNLTERGCYVPDPHEANYDAL